MRPYLVFNPGSRNGRAARVLDRCRAALEAAGRPYEIGRTESLDDAARLARGAVEQGLDPVVAVGGDGTINRVLNGILRAGAERTDARLGVLYAGTSPDFCIYHGLPTSPENAVAALLSGKERPVDVCRITMGNGSESPAVLHFASSANVGIGAAVARGANRTRGVLGDAPGTLAAALAAILRHRPRAMTVITADGPIRLDRVWNVTVGKNPHIASGIRLGEGAAVPGGRLFVFAVHGVGRARFLSALPGAYTGAIAADPRFLLTTARKVRLEAQGPPLEVEFDGDPAGHSPVEIEVLPDAVSLMGA